MKILNKLMGITKYEKETYNAALEMASLYSTIHENSIKSANELLDKVDDGEMDIDAAKDEIVSLFEKQQEVEETFNGFIKDNQADILHGKWANLYSKEFIMNMAGIFKFYEDEVHRNDQKIIAICLRIGGPDTDCIYYDKKKGEFCIKEEFFESTENDSD